MADGSTGSVLFTDLVGFTEFTDAEGDAAAVAVLDAQRELVDVILGGGVDARVVKELGDGLMVFARSATDALLLACAFLDAVDQRRHRGDFPLAVRLGLHHGPVVERGDDVVGGTVNVASRIADIAGPGELLVSDEVIGALAGDAGRFVFRAVGPTSVKGIGSPVWLSMVSRVGSGSDLYRTVSSGV